MRTETELELEVEGHDGRQVPVLFTVSAVVSLDADEATVAGLSAEGFYEHPRTGRDVTFDVSDLSEHQRMTAEEALIEEAEKQRRWSARAAAAPMADAGTTWRERR